MISRLLDRLYQHHSSSHNCTSKIHTLTSLICLESKLKLFQGSSDIHDFMPVYELLASFPNLKELNLSDNDMQTLPNDLSRLRVLANLNLNGNNFANVRFFFIVLIVQTNSGCLEKFTTIEKSFHQPSLRRISRPHHENP